MAAPAQTGSAPRVTVSSTSPARNPTSDPKSLSSYQGKSAPAKDIEGNPRPLGGAHDIGAYEYVE